MVLKAFCQDEPSELSPSFETYIRVSDEAVEIAVNVKIIEKRMDISRQ
jgi:hypothetical protein